MPLLPSMTCVPSRAATRGRSSCSMTRVTTVRISRPTCSSGDGSGAAVGRLAGSSSTSIRRSRRSAAAIRAVASPSQELVATHPVGSGANSATSACTWLAMSSRMRRTTAIGCPDGSSTGQSRYSVSGSQRTGVATTHRDAKIGRRQVGRGQTRRHGVADVDADLSHGLNRHRIHPLAWCGPGGPDVLPGRRRPRAAGRPPSGCARRCAHRRR